MFVWWSLARSDGASNVALIARSCDGGTPVPTRLYADNCRCFVNFELRPGQMSLHGVNGSGKTSVFDLLWDLRGVVRLGEDVGQYFPATGRTAWEPPRSQRVELGRQTSRGGRREWSLALRDGRTRVGRWRRIRFAWFSSARTQNSSASCFRYARSDSEKYACGERPLVPPQALG